MQPFPMTDLQQNDQIEYQYDESETETFLVDLDLSSVNGFNKIHPKKNSRRLRAPKEGSKKKKNEALDASDDQGSADETYAPSPEQDEAQGIVSESQAQNKRNTLPASYLQVLDIGTGNPIISFRDQLYSCSWTDMIGTSMFFTQPSGSHMGPSLLSNADLNLIGTSQISLVGQRARLVPRPPSRKRERSVDESEQASEVATASVDGTSFPGFSSTNWRRNMERRKQANFLDGLMQAKRARGETDIVTTISDARTNIMNHVNTSYLAAEQSLRIRNLSDRVVKGDARAVTALKEIHFRLEGGISELDPNLEDAVDIPTPNAAKND